MSFTVLDMPQRSAEWYRARCGRLTASEVRDVFAAIKSGEAAVRRNLRVRLTLERITGVPEEGGFVSAEMRRGIELEAEAIGAYEAMAGVGVRSCGFIAHDELMIGCSPDGILDDFEGGAEIKAPNSATHLGYLRGGVLPAEYRPQITHSLLVTDALYWDFCSYDPRFPEPLQTFVIRTRREDVDLKAHELAVRLFLKEVEQEVASVRAMMASGVTA